MISSVMAGSLSIARLGRATLERLARGTAGGRVHSVFDRAINVLWHDGHLLTLHGPAPLAAPFAVAVRQMPPRGAMTPAMRIEPSDLDWTQAESVPLEMPRGPLCFDIDSLPAPPPGSALGTGAGLRARNMLGRSLATRDPLAFADAARQLIGLGKGLTPAGDDCVVGALAAMHRLAPEWLAAGGALLERLADTATTRTTDVARDFLLEALHGRFAEPVRTLLTARAADLAAHAARDLLAMGATSGADTLGGIRLACKALARSGTRPAVAT
jgi:hypothetical protein